MGVKKDPSGKRWVEMQVEVPGTPEEVWRAMATGPGMSCWWTPSEVEERVGGKITFHFGEMGDSKGTVTKWEPPTHFHYEERDWMPGAPPVATEIVVEAKAGGTCIVRMVHSLFASDESWDDQLGSFESGWPGFFRILKLYMTHFAGQPASILSLRTTTQQSEADAWKQLKDDLGVANKQVGQPCRSADPRVPLAGVVEFANDAHTHNELLLRLNQPTDGAASLGTFSWGGNTHVALQCYFYGEQAADVVARNETAWRTWLQERFPAA